MKHLSSIDRKRLFIEIQRMIDPRLDGSIHRIRTVIEPVVAFSGIGKFYSRDVLYIFVTIFKGNDQPQGEPVLLGQRLSIHLEHKKNPVPSQFLQRETFILGIGGLEINVFCGGVRLNPVKEVIDKKTKLDVAKLHDTKFYYEQEWHDAVIYDRGKLGVGTVVSGPAIVVEMDATTLVLPGHAAIVDDVGNLLINPA